jgi:hypothetical protein
MKRIAAACHATTLPHDGGKTSNRFYVGDKQYFYEITGRDQPDNGIRGTIHLCWDEAGKQWARKVGSFRITGRGECIRGPKLFQTTNIC